MYIIGFYIRYGDNGEPYLLPTMINSMYAPIKGMSRTM